MLIPLQCPQALVIQDNSHINSECQLSNFSDDPSIAVFGENAQTPGIERNIQQVVLADTSISTLKSGSKYLIVNSNSSFSFHDINGVTLPSPPSGSYTLDESDLLLELLNSSDFRKKGKNLSIDWSKFTSKYWYWAKRFTLECPGRYKLYSRDQNKFLLWAKKKVQ